MAIGLALLMGSVMFGIDACTSGDDGRDPDLPAVVEAPIDSGQVGAGIPEAGTRESGVGESGQGDDGGGDTEADSTIPEQDFSIQQSCEEIRADYMQAEPGSDEERWALEAAEEVCFGQ